MTEGKKKKYVNLWIKEDKKGRRYLGGRDKAADVNYFVYTEEEGQVLKKTVSGGPFQVVGTMDKRSGDDGSDYLALDGMYVSENRFFNEEDPYMTYSEQNGGGYVLDKDGNKIPAPEYTLSIPVEA